MSLLLAGIFSKVRHTTKLGRNFYVASAIRGGAAEGQKPLKVFQKMEQMY